MIGNLNRVHAINLFEEGDHVKRSKFNFSFIDLTINDLHDMGDHNHWRGNTCFAFLSLYYDKLKTLSSIKYMYKPGITSLNEPGIRDLYIAIFTAPTGCGKSQLYLDFTSILRVQCSSGTRKIVILIELNMMAMFSLSNQKASYINR